MSRGFTIVELLIVVAIVGMLAAVAAPGMNDLVASTSVRTAASDFYAALAAARSEAIKRRADTTVAAVEGDWKNGWTVKVGADTYQQADPLPRHVAVYVAAVTPIVYGMNGRIKSGQQTMVFYSASSPAVAARCVGVDPNGMPRVRMDTNHVATDGCN